MRSVQSLAHLPGRAVVAVAAGALVVGGLLVPSAPVAAAGTAAGAPGALSHFDLARKDCLGTARNTTSKVWFTVADGVLSDVYYPTIDNTNVETLQYVVTDGSTFTDLQTRDMTYTVSALDRVRAWPAGSRARRRAAGTGSSPTTSPTPRGPASSCTRASTTSPAAGRCSSTSASTRRSTATVAAARTTPAHDDAVIDHSTGRRSRCPATRTPRRTRPTATTPSPSTRPCGRTARSSRRAAGTPARRATD